MKLDKLDWPAQEETLVHTVEALVAGQQDKEMAKHA
jgi:hypothetical protein